MTLKEIRQDAEILAISEAIVAKGSALQAAKHLGVHRNTLRRRMRKYGITLKINALIAEIRKQRKIKLTPAP